VLSIIEHAATTALAAPEAFIPAVVKEREGLDSHYCADCSISSRMKGYAPQVQPSERPLQGGERGVISRRSCRLFSSIFLLMQPVAAQQVQKVLNMNVVLAPRDPFQVRVGIGQAQFLPFSCEGGPADVVISLSTYSERADPLLFLSLNPKEPPSFQQHDASSFGQWREDAAGDHYVVAKAVGPRGGMLGLVNMRHFAGEEIDGILSIHCTYIVAFDTLFWDHLRSSAVCPVGDHMQAGHLVQATTFCSGHGRCGKNAVCVCDGDWTGSACQHSKSDLVVAAEGRYRFKVATGHYQYFRVRVPPRFPGGYLEVKSQSSLPLVVLVRSDDLPTKSNFELSNFDDWVNSRNSSVLKFKVMSAYTIEGSYNFLGPGRGGPRSSGISGLTTPSPTPAVGRRTFEIDEMSKVTSWSDLFGSSKAVPFSGNQEAHRWARRLDATSDVAFTTPGVKCPKNTPSTSAPECRTPSFTQCQDSCMRCVGCVKGGQDDRGCTDACNACVSPGCINTLALCAGNTSCQGDDAMHCEEGCGKCMACFDSNDRGCGGCRCCIGCLPLAAKCSLMEQQPAEYNRFVFVGIYKHRRFWFDRGTVNATATISLTADPNFEREELPSSWVADLYDPFHDIRSLEITQQKVYPDGEQFIYQLRLPPSEELRLEVRLYHDRMTLLHLQNIVSGNDMVLEFRNGPNITHVLQSSRAAPKTFFDFDIVPTQVSRRVKITASSSPSIWCAIFGAADGYVQITAKSLQEKTFSPVSLPFAPPTGGKSKLNVGWAMVCVLAVLMGIVTLSFMVGGVQRVAENLGLDTTIPLSERFASLVRTQNPHESTASLTRSGSLQGYIGSDVIDRSVEDQYLHRGGIGDDGI